MGIQINGQTDTVTAIDGSLNVGGDVTIPGVLTYDDVTNIDSIGVITARSDIHVLGGTLRIKDSGNSAQRGAIYGDASSFHINAGVNNLIAYSAGTERLRINADGRVGINTNSELRGQFNIFEGTDFNIGSTGGLDNIYLSSDATPGNNVKGASIAWSRPGYRDRRAAAIASVQTTSDEDQVGLSFFTHPSTDATANLQEQVRITHDGKVGIGTDNPETKLHLQDGQLTIKGTGEGGPYLYRDGGYGSDIVFHASRGTIASPTASVDTDKVGNINFAGYDGSAYQRRASINGVVDGSVSSNTVPTAIIFRTGTNTVPTERLRVDSAGTIKCGTSATLKAEINSAIGGHQFISQCDDNNNGFEIYQQHGSTTTRNTFAVYANTGGGNAQELQFSIRGDGAVTKPKNPAFSANLSSGNLNAATHSDVIIFNNEHFDNGNNYDTSNGRFTAPIAGRYYFGVQIYAGFALTGVRVMHSAFVKNGSVTGSADMFGGASDHGGTSYHPTGCGHIFLDLAVNDWVAFTSGTFSGSGSGHATIYAANGTRFFGYLVG